MQCQMHVIAHRRKGEHAHRIDRRQLVHPGDDPAAAMLEVLPGKLVKAAQEGPADTARDAVVVLRQLCRAVAPTPGVPMSRLTIDIDDQQHQNLKAMAALQGKTIKQCAIERLFPATTAEDDAWRNLKSLLAQRISEGLTGGVSPQSIDSIVAEELQPEVLPRQKKRSNRSA